MQNVEQIAQEEGNNRSFVILVAALGGLLVLGIGAFVAWALLVAPGMRAGVDSQNEAVFATNTAIAIAAGATETAAVTPTSTDTPVPTHTPRPTSTATPVETATPEEETPEATATLTLQTPTAAAGENSAGTVPNTGIGILGGAALAGGLAFLLVLVRRLRFAA